MLQVLTPEVSMEPTEEISILSIGRKHSELMPDGMAEVITLLPAGVKQRCMAGE